MHYVCRMSSKKLDVRVAISLARVDLSDQSSVVRLSLFYFVVPVKKYLLVNLPVNRRSSKIQKLATLVVVVVGVDATKT